MRFSETRHQGVDGEQAKVPSGPLLLRPQAGTQRGPLTPLCLWVNFSKLKLTTPLVARQEDASELVINAKGPSIASLMELFLNICSCRVSI